MKHIQLLENYERKDFEKKHLGTGKIEIGYIGEGGYGTHPSIFSKYVLENLINNHTEFKFFATAYTDYLPEALICLWDDKPEGWFIKPIPRHIAIEVKRIMGSNHKDSFYEYEKNEKQKGMEILRLVGYYHSMDEIKNFTIIPNPKLNTIYWSDNPEHSHGYWEPPYREITMNIGPPSVPS